MSDSRTNDADGQRDPGTLPTTVSGSSSEPVGDWILQSRYLRRDGNGVVETPDELWLRVARSVARAECAYRGEAAQHRWEEKFYELMKDRLFLPNSPTLFNAGGEPQMLSACFVLPVPDSLEGILQVTKEAGLIQKSGGGVGFDFSKVRPRGARVRSTSGVASGPVSFMKAMNKWADVIKQGGRRRSANMGVLRVDHPDIEEFVTCKSDESELHAFNISVGVTDGFMEALNKGSSYGIVDPCTGEEVGRRDAREVWDLICESAWRCGDPGVLFIDTVNAANPTPHLGAITATNPCGEQPLLPYDSCNLGSINLTKMVVDGETDWERLRRTVWDAVRLLDDVIDVNSYPLPEIERVTKGNRKIGLGVMGFADMLYMLGVPYDSDEAVDLGGRLMREISSTARQASEELAVEKEPFVRIQPMLLNAEMDRKRTRRYEEVKRKSDTPTGVVRR